jgi:hypothetical protein
MLTLITARHELNRQTGAESRGDEQRGDRTDEQHGHRHGVLAHEVLLQLLHEHAEPRREADQIAKQRQWVLLKRQRRRRRVPTLMLLWLVIVVCTSQRMNQFINKRISHQHRYTQYKPNRSQIKYLLHIQPTFVASGRLRTTSQFCRVKHYSDLAFILLTWKIFMPLNARSLHIFVLKKCWIARH